MEPVDKIKNYLTELSDLSLAPSKKEYPQPSDVNVQKLTTEQMNELSQMQRTAPQMTKTVTSQGTTTTQLVRWVIPWDDVAVTKEEAAQFKQTLCTKGWFWGVNPGPLTKLIYHPKTPYAHEDLAEIFYKTEGEILPNGQELFGGEKCAIWMYTSGCQTYRLINGTMNNDTTSLGIWLKYNMKLNPDLETSQIFLELCQKEVPLIMEMTMSGINKLPPFKGTLYRGNTIPEEDLVSWKRGKFMITQKIFSCTSWGSQAEEFAIKSAYAYTRETNQKHIPVLYVFASEQAKSIAPYSAERQEKEYVYPPGQIFHSLAVDEETVPGLTVIYLQEVH